MSVFTERNPTLRGFAVTRSLRVAAYVCLFALTAIPGSAAAQNRSASPDQNIQPGQLVREMVHNELEGQKNDHTQWRYRELSQQDGKPQELRDVFDTKDGDISRLLAVNGVPLSASQQAKENERIQKLIGDPDQIRKELKKRSDDVQNEREMLKMLPDAFRYRYVSTQGDLIELKFTPDPSFHAPNRQAQVFHAMEGKIWIDARQKRLARIDGVLMSEVKFFDGLLGHLDKGGTFSVMQKDEGDGHWEMTRLNVGMTGRALFFKTIAVQQKESFTDYRQIPENTTIHQAAELLEKDSATSAEAQSAESAAGQ